MPRAADNLQITVIEEGEQKTLTLRAANTTGALYSQENPCERVPDNVDFHGVVGGEDKVVSVGWVLFS